MSRSEILHLERDRILSLLAKGSENKAKLLISLMDIDEEIEELRRSNASYPNS